MIKIYTYFSVFILLQFTTTSLFGQLSFADSIMLQNNCTEPLYIDYISYPGNWYSNHEINSISDLEQQIDINYPFYNSELLTSYQDIILNSNIVYDSIINTEIDTFNIAHSVDLFHIPNPFVKLNFTLNSKNGHANAILDSCINSNNNSTAYYIITGTGSNQLSAITNDTTNYHILNCEVKDFLKQYGDVYLGGTPNEDNRAIYFNNKKLNRYGFTTGYPTYLGNYLAQFNKASGVNKLIEIVAFIKYLKTKYNKVNVLGLSAGGTEALWASLLSNPTSTIVASGYSVLCETDSLSLAINSNFYSNYLQYFNKTTIYNYLFSTNTKYLFCQAQNDNALSQLDIDSSYTQNYFSTLNNVFFNNNYNNHSFPPCQIIDSFFNYTIYTNTDNISTKFEKLTFQNPINDNLKINITASNLLPCELILYNSSGEVLLKKSLNTPYVEIDMRNLPAGNYFLRLFNSQQNISAKILKN